MGNVFVAGSFTGIADFGSTTLTSSGSSEAFVTKLDASCNCIWAKRFGTANFESGNGVAVDTLVGQRPKCSLWSTMPLVIPLVIITQPDIITEAPMAKQWNRGRIANSA